MNSICFDIYEPFSLPQSDNKELFCFFSLKMLNIAFSTVWHSEIMADFPMPDTQQSIIVVILIFLLLKVVVEF